jgi:citronellol/citronellal dehydrogenase
LGSICVRLYDPPMTTEAPSPFAPDLLRGRRALVTGGGTGIGRAVALGLAQAGADIVIAARRKEVLDVAAEEIAAWTGRNVDVDLVNIRDVEQVQLLAERHGDVDIVINNAGGQFPSKARDLSANGWRSVIDLNLNGTWNMTQAFGNRMLDGNGGTIVQIIATISRGIPGIAHSAAARAGVLELTRTLAFEWGPRVRLNCVAPGQFRTDGWDKTYADGVGDGVGQQPIPHAGHVSDIANAVVFLASPASRFITGEVMFVDGGLILQGPMSALPEGGYPERNEPDNGW